MDALLEEARLADAALLAHLTRQAWGGRVAPDSTGHRVRDEPVVTDLQTGGGE